MLLQIGAIGMDGGFMLVCLAVLVIWSVALVAIANSRFNDSTTKLCWFFIVLFLNLIGVLLFFIWGRKEIYGNTPVK